MPISDSDDLSELVDAPNERLSVEYKAAIDFSDRIAKAKLAKHIAALANHGGGHIVVGFDDDLKPTAELPPVFGRDDVASVVKVYLDPTFQCDIRLARSSAGRDYPVIVVPAHGAAPICAKANGPDSDGKIQGVRRGAYYIRKAGPESEAIATSAEWAPVIRRCALFERASILGALDLALRGRGTDGEEMAATRLERWHLAAAKAYAASIQEHGAPVEQLGARYFQFSYSIDPSEGGPPHDELLEVLEQTEQAVDREVHTGWPLLIVIRDRGGATFRTAADVDDGQLEFLETNFIREGSKVQATDLWRVSASGLVTVMRGYLEDSASGQRSGFRPGVDISPLWLAKNLAEIVTHARVFARSFPNSARVFFRCEWLGLQGRIASDPHRGRWFGLGHPAADDRRLVTRAFSIGEMVASPQDVIYELAGPVIRALGTSGAMNRQWLASEALTWPRT
jgi:hypothetical protein